MESNTSSMFNGTHNASDSAAVPNSWKNLYAYAIYFFEGSIMFVGNMSVALAIWWYKALRGNKGYFVFAFMFFCDSLNGLAQLFASVYRTILLFIGTHDVLVSQWECMKKLHTYVWSFSEPCAALMLAAISFDRVMLVKSPGKYLSSYRLTYVSICIPFVWSGCGVLVAFFLAYNSDRTPSVAQCCLLSFGLGKAYWAYHGSLSVFGASLSITLYITVIILNKKRLKDGNQTNKAILAGQQRLTKSLGISCVVTLFVFLIPRLIGTALNYVPGLDQGWVSFLMMIFYWIIGNFNAVINLFIFLRIEAIRTGVKALWQCKKMSANLNVWVKTTSIAPAKSMTVAPAKKRPIPQAWQAQDQLAVVSS